MQPKLVEIDLTKTTKQGGAGLEVGPTYLCLIDGSFYVGSFSMQWYGLNFNNWGMSGLQYDPPPENYSGWQKIWLIENRREIADSLQLEYAECRRKYAIEHGLRSNGKKIDESAPIEAFYYHPKVSAMPADPDDEDY